MFNFFSLVFFLSSCGNNNDKKGNTNSKKSKAINGDDYKN